MVVLPGGGFLFVGDGVLLLHCRISHSRVADCLCRWSRRQVAGSCSWATACCCRTAGSITPGWLTACAGGRAARRRVPVRGRRRAAVALQDQSLKGG